MLQTWLVTSFLWLSHLPVFSIEPVLPPPTPNPQRSPGDLCTEESDDFLEYRYEEQFPYCSRNVPYEVKNRIYEQYGVPEHLRGDYTIDHIIPLSIGGSNAVRNLWPEHKSIKAQRPELEYCLYLRVRDGELSQREAVQIVLDAKFGRHWACLVVK